MDFRRFWERITAAVDTLRGIWQCISAGLEDLAGGLKPERIQEPAAPDDPTETEEDVS